jgi:hypothetical protein
MASGVHFASLGYLTRNCFKSSMVDDACLR